MGAPFGRHAALRLFHLDFWVSLRSVSLKYQNDQNSPKNCQVTTKLTEGSAINFMHVYF